MDKNRAKASWFSQDLNTNHVSLKLESKYSAENIRDCRLFIMLRQEWQPSNHTVQKQLNTQKNSKALENALVNKIYQCNNVRKEIEEAAEKLKKLFQINH